MSNLAPGYRFYPTEEELIGFYLRNKLEKRRDDLDRVIPVYDIYSLDPWQLPSISGELCTGDVEQWFFFSPRQEREAHGGRPNRITPSGYWKATGSPCYVFATNNKIVGLKKTMVFYEGRAPLGKKTKWKLNEYRALEEATSSGANPQLRNEFSLCRVYIKSGCVRSFDRRPLIATSEAITNRREISNIYLCNVAGGNSSSASSSHEKLVKEEREGSYEGSSSGDHFHLSFEETINDGKMMNDLDNLLESLDWD
ncbi:hypothetical protein MRB53_016522 [Persea americana]|uniref:Uncharacterized protein n=1 Tax=Persea americana TaxID=3435 RepID=A0ACC2M336_PERAE|nr:hypothetical protein MRB53_016522 [Persea americana]